MFLCVCVFFFFWGGGGWGGGLLLLLLLGVLVCLFLGVFFAFPSYISGVHHFLGEVFAYVTVFCFFLIQPLR